MAGDGSWFDSIFHHSVEPIHVGIFETTLAISYSLPRHYPNPLPAVLEHCRISGEQQETITTEMGEEIHYIRWMTVIVEPTDANYCGIENFLRDGRIDIESVGYAITNVSRDSVNAQVLKLTKFGYQGVGNPYGGRQ